MSPFKGLVRDIRDVQAPEGSTNAALLALPQQRVHTHDMQGRVLLFPRTGIIGVPFDPHKDSWSVVVVDGTACVKENGYESYPRGGYHIDVSNLEMQTAIELDTNRADYAPRAEDWVEGQARDRLSLVQILWRSAMPGWSPIDQDHPDWAGYLGRAEEIIENPFGNEGAKR